MSLVNDWYLGISAISILPFFCSFILVTAYVSSAPVAQFVIFACTRILSLRRDGISWLFFTPTEAVWKPCHRFAVQFATLSVSISKLIYLTKPAIACACLLLWLSNSASWTWIKLQLPDSMKQSQGDLYLETYQVLDVEIGRLRGMQRWQAAASTKVRLTSILMLDSLWCIYTNDYKLMSVNRVKVVGKWLYRYGCKTDTNLTSSFPSLVGTFLKILFWSLFIRTTSRSIVISVCAASRNIFTVTSYLEEVSNTLFWSQWFYYCWVSNSSQVICTSSREPTRRWRGLQLRTCGTAQVSLPLSFQELAFLYFYSFSSRLKSVMRIDYISGLANIFAISSCALTIISSYLPLVRESTNHLPYMWRSSVPCSRRICRGVTCIVVLFGLATLYCTSCRILSTGEITCAWVLERHFCIWHPMSNPCLS